MKDLKKCKECKILPSLCTKKTGWFSSEQFYGCRKCGKHGKGCSFTIRGAIDYITRTWNYKN